MGVIKYLKTKLGSLLVFGDAKTVEVPETIAEKVKEQIKAVESIPETVVSEDKKETYDDEISAVTPKDSIIENIVNKADDEDNTKESEFAKYSKRFRKEFTIRDGIFYLKSDKNKFPVPQNLLNLFEGYHFDSIDDIGLVRFWKLLVKNENKDVVRELIDYIKVNDIAISKYGYMHAFKAVRPGELQVRSIYPQVLIDFVNNSVEEVRSKKQSIKNYIVLNEERGYSLLHKQTKRAKENMQGLPIVDELHALVEAFKEEQKESQVTVYQPKSSGPYGNDIQIGKAVWMPRAECNTNRDDCAEGLHVGHYKYVSSFAGNDSTVLNILVNPKNIVNVPQNQNKIRCCEYFPVSVYSEKGLKSDLKDKSLFADEDYVNYELDTLKENNSEEYKKYQEIYKDYIKTRVKTI